MNLEITSYNNRFKIKGPLNRQNVVLFTNEFDDVFERFNSFTLSIEGLTNIDKYGVDALARLHNESISKGKPFSIVGMGCDDLYNHFKAEEQAA